MTAKRPIHETWWQVDKNKDGTAKCVWVNKPIGSARGLWTFERAEDAGGAPVIQVVKSEHDDEGLSAKPVLAREFPEVHRHQRAPGNTTILTSELAGLVGWRTAEAALRKLYSGHQTDGPQFSADDAARLLAEDVTRAGS